MDLRYPIGRFEWPASLNSEDLRKAIAEIAAAPAELRAAVNGLSDEQLETPYRPGGWTVRQVIHHVADSHMNSYMRFRFALTEPEPTIKAYDENVWAQLPDASRAPLDPSLGLLDGLHRRWVLLLESFTPAEWARTFRHPEHPNPLRLDSTAALYAWHGKHHAAHITGLRAARGW
jgi:uncharacterized damage-inducible protein DinB